MREETALETPIIPISPNLTVTLLVNQDNTDVHFHFVGWDRAREFWCAVPMLKLTHILEEAADALRDEEKKTFRERDVLLAVNRTTVLRVLRVNLVETVVQVTGFYDGASYEFDIPAEFAELLCVRGREVLEEAKPAPVFGDDHLPF